jgi:hypothetical protein
VVEIVDTEAKIVAFLPTLAVRLTVRHLFNQAREKIHGYRPRERGAIPWRSRSRNSRWERAKLVHA